MSEVRAPTIKKRAKEAVVQKRTPAEQRAEIERADAVRQAEAASMDAEGKRRQAGHKAEADAIAAGADDDKRHRDTARYEALAREHGADLSEEGFNEALRKVAKPQQ